MLINFIGICETSYPMLPK